MNSLGGSRCLDLETLNLPLLVLFSLSLSFSVFELSSELGYWANTTHTHTKREKEPREREERIWAWSVNNGGQSSHRKLIVYENHENGNEQWVTDNEMQIILLGDASCTM